jgi:hypothetical protein
MPRSLTLLMLAVGLLPAADSWILRPEEPWSYTWEERRLANGDGVSMPGFGRTALPVAPGLWGEAALGVTLSAEGNAYQVPGGPPIRRGAQAQAWAELWGAWGPLFLHLRPEAVIGQDSSAISNPLAREAWTGRATQLTLDPVETAPRATVGITGLGHILALSNEPFRWGEGIFGGVMLGQGWRGFPHVVLATRGPQQPAPQGSWLEPLALGYELVVGELSEPAPQAGDGVQFAGFRMALRWEAVTLAWSKSLLFGGDKQPDYPWKSVATTLATWRSGNDGSTAPGEPNPNRFASLGLRLDWPRHVAWSVEYGIDDQNGRVDGQSLNTPLTQEARWTSASWTATADWLDITGDGDWRLALEWFRSESYVYGHSLYPWSDNGFSLAHADGGNANSIRLLVQHIDADEGRWTAVAGWRRQGWRNAASGNPNTARKDAGVPGSDTYAERPWDRWSLDGRCEQPLNAHWRWWLESGLAWDRNRDFQTDSSGLDALLGCGVACTW